LRYTRILIERHARMKNRIQAITIISIFLITVGLALRSEAENDPSPNIILITVDSLRLDHLGCYGYLKNTSANIDKLAKEGTIFTQAIAQASWTCPSITSIATSTYPSTHKVYYWDVVLSPQLPTITEILKQQGYYNFFCSGHDYALFEIFGLNRGFDKWCSSDGTILHGDKLNGHALKFLENNYKRKFFLWIHYMDTHDHSVGILSEKKGLSSASCKVINMNKYDIAITQVDRQIGIIIKKLEKLNIDKNTLIIITADHGEEVCEHGICFNHGGFLWDSLIRVPLIIVWRGHLPNNNRKFNQVRHIDIIPTICDILKIKKPISFEGQSLLPIISGRESSLRSAFSEHNERVADSQNGGWNYTKFSIRSGDWKLIHTFGPLENKNELYNLKDDPGESNNLAESEEAQFKLLKKKLEIWIKRPRANVTPLEKVFDQRSKEKLKSLGYL
jgi:arylsulfatase A-like enzyme